MTDKKIIKTGHSLAVTIPAAFVRFLGLKAGQVVSVKAVPDEGKLYCTFTGNKQLSLKVFGRQEK